MENPASSPIAMTRANIDAVATGVYAFAFTRPLPHRALRSFCVLKRVNKRNAFFWKFGNIRFRPVEIKIKLHLTAQITCKNSTEIRKKKYNIRIYPKPFAYSPNCERSAQPNTECIRKYNWCAFVHFPMFGFVVIVHLFIFSFCFDLLLLLFALRYTRIHTHTHAPLKFCTSE